MAHSLSIDALKIDIRGDNMIRMYLVFIMLISSNFVMAEIHKLSTVTNAVNSDIYTLAVETNENGELIMLHMLAENLPGEDEDDHYNLTQVKKGVVLVQRDGRDVVTLFGKNIDVIKGGDVTVKFLYSGVTGKFKSETLELLFQDGKWILQTDDRVVVNKIHFIAKKAPFIGVIGLKEMEIN